MAKRFTWICLCFFILCCYTACKKSKSSTVVAVADNITFPAYSDVPYDTSGVHAIFSTNILFDSTKGDRECSLYFTAWFTQKVNKGFIDSCVINANGNSLTEYKRYYAANTPKFTPAASFRPDTAVAWVMTGPTGAGFTYSNAAAFPGYTINLPDTIASKRNDTFRFNAVTVSNADTVLLKIYVPVSKDSTHAMVYCVAPTGNNVVLDAALISSIAKQDVGVTVSVFSHQTQTINGFKYMFIKEYTFGRNIWFK